MIFPEVIYIQPSSGFGRVPYLGFDEKYKEEIREGEVAIYKLVKVGKKNTTITIE